MDARPPWAPGFPITRAQLESANVCFRPALAPAEPLVSAAVPATKVLITTQGVEVDLVASFLPATLVPQGVPRVAGLQSVSSNVAIDFSRALPLYWMASAWKHGDIAPNASYFVFSSDSDDFALQINEVITITHDASGWHVPAFDSVEYSVDVGFGVGLDYVRWGYSAPCAPNTSLVLKAGSYELARSDGHENIGDPVAATQAWVMPMGYDYTLRFDSSGNGVLKQV